MNQPQTVNTGIPGQLRQDVRWIWDFDKLWAQFEAFVRGGSLKYNAETGNYEVEIPADAKPLMNEKGINAMMTDMRASVNLVTGSGILEKEFIFAMAAEKFDVIATKLYRNMDEYEINENDYESIVKIFMDAYFSNLSKSVNGTALYATLQTEQRNENVVVGGQTNDRRLFGFKIG